MSVENQIPSLCKIYSPYGELPEEVFDETDISNRFYLNIFDILQSQHRIVRINKKLQQKNFCTQIVLVTRFKDTAALHPPRRSELLQKWS